MMRSSILLIGIITITLTGYLSGQATLKKGEPAPQIHVDKWLLNKPSRKPFKNKFIVLDFWATWCKPCLENVPHINALQETFKDENIIFVQMTNEYLNKGSSVFSRVNFDTPVAIDDANQTGINFGDGISKLAHYPFMVLIDDQNIVRWYGSSTLLTEDMIRDLLQRKNIDKLQYDVNKHQDKIMGSEHYLKSNFGFELWNDLFMDPNITEYTYIEEKSEELTGKYAKLGPMKMPNGGCFPSQTIRKIFQEFFPQKKLQLTADLEDRVYNFLYVNKNLSSDSEGELLQTMANQLGLDLKIFIAKEAYYEIRINDLELLKAANHKPREKDKKMGIITGKNLQDLAKRLSSESDYFFVYKGKLMKKFKFDIDKESFDTIKESLSCYGLRLVKKKMDIETVHLSSK